MLVLGIDPHIKKLYGFSVWSDGKLMRCGLGNLQDIATIIGICDYTLIEDQYMGKSVKTTKELARSAGMIAGLCEYCDVGYEYVNVATWQACFGLIKMKKKEKYQTMYSVIKKEFDIVISDDDIASAIFIGWFGVKNEDARCTIEEYGREKANRKGLNKKA